MPADKLIAIVVEPLRVLVFRKYPKSVGLCISGQGQTAEKPLIIANVPVNAGRVRVIRQRHGSIESKHAGVDTVTTAQIVRQWISIVAEGEQGRAKADAFRV